MGNTFDDLSDLSGGHDMFEDTYHFQSVFHGFEEDDDFGSPPPTHTLRIETVPMPSWVYCSKDEPYVPFPARFYTSSAIQATYPFHSSSLYDGHVQQHISPLAHRHASPVETISSSSSASDSTPSSSIGSHSYDHQSFIHSPGSPYLGHIKDTSFASPIGIKNEQSSIKGPTIALHEIQSHPDDTSEHSPLQSRRPAVSYDSSTFKQHNDPDCPSYPDESLDLQADLDQLHDEATKDLNNTLTEDSEDSDSAYSPSPARSPKRARTTCKPAKDHHHRTTSSPQKLYKRLSPASTTTPNPVHHRNLAPRAYPCPLLHYGCRKDFTSKNEWKRHFTTQHLLLRVWRCDLCPANDQAHGHGPHDFNRKDLFEQHVRRTHFSDKTAPKRSKLAAPAAAADSHNDKASAEVAAKVAAACERCEVKIRSPPAATACVDCGAQFCGADGCALWLEHTGRHLAAAAKEGAAKEGCERDWVGNGVLRAWLLHEGFLVADARGVVSVVAREVGKGARKRGHEVDAEGEPEY